MKNKTIYISVIFIIIGYIIFDQNKKIESLSSNIEIITISNELLSIIKAEKPVKEFKFGCTIQINHKFGMWTKWRVITDGLEYTFKGSSIILTNSKFEILKSWFPPRDSNEKSSAGNSVSVTVKEYSIELRSESYTNSARSLFTKLIKACADN